MSESTWYEIPDRYGIVREDLWGSERCPIFATVTGEYVKCNAGEPPPSMKYEVFLVAVGFTDEVGFERFQALVAGGDVAVKRYGIVQFL